MSTESFRRAVWDRVTPEEFPSIARLMGHGKHMEVAFTEFEGERALIQLNTDANKQYRMHALRVGDTWYVDDILFAVEPLVFVSKRRQAEGVLAVRDFRRGLEAGDLRVLVASCSRGFGSETWGRMTEAKLEALRKPLAKIHDETGGTLGDVQRSRDGAWAAAMGEASSGYTFYFAEEGGKLVVDDVALPGGPPSMRVRLRKRIEAR